MVVFVLLPAAFAFFPHDLPAIPTLLLVGVYCAGVLIRDRRFDRGRLWNGSALRRPLLQITGIFSIVALLIAVVVRWLSPELFMSLPRSKPMVWLTILLMYPVLSVYPQELIYRAFFLHRYRALFPNDRSLLAASALAFAWVHIIFRNPLAVALTVPAGLLFGYRYVRSQSLAVASFEHALYGCLMFTIGLGGFFYYGAQL